jgi:hypothetical protein
VAHFSTTSSPGAHPAPGRAGAPPRGVLRRKAVISILGAGGVTVWLGFVLAGQRGNFNAALHRAPVPMLCMAVGLQIVALLARSEAWLICVQAAGGSVGRRLLFRAAGVGYLASVLNGSVGMAARIGSLRRVAGDRAPGAATLVAAEVPIITVEVALAAIFSFTLVAPLGVPWWAPVIALAVVVAAVLMLRRLSGRYRSGVGAGLAIVRGAGRTRMVAFTLLAVCAQVGRNWLMLHAIGVDVSAFDAMALLIAMFTLGQLPAGPSIGPAAAVLILGAHGVAATAAAGVLLTVTGVSGSLCYAVWAGCDRLLAGPVVFAADVAPAVSG